MWIFFVQTLIQKWSWLEKEEKWGLAVSVDVAMKSYIIRVVLVSFDNSWNGSRLSNSLSGSHNKLCLHRKKFLLFQQIIKCTYVFVFQYHTYWTEFFGDLKKDLTFIDHLLTFLTKNIFFVMKKDLHIFNISFYQPFKYPISTKK